MIKDYKVNSRNSTVCGYPGRDFDWSKFCWDGNEFYNKNLKMKAELPYKDNFLIAPDCEYLHIPYDFSECCTTYRVRPNDSMYAGKVYRGHLIKKQTAIKKDDGWYWRLEFSD